MKRFTQSAAPTLCSQVTTWLCLASFPHARRLYDLDQDGCISAQELYSMLQQIVGEGVTDQQLERVVQATMLQYDTDGEWCLDFREFVALMNR
jgi:Ca2+-binding EF-hand superfamily protein